MPTLHEQAFDAMRAAGFKTAADALQHSFSGRMLDPAHLLLCYDKYAEKGTFVNTDDKNVPAYFFHAATQLKTPRSI